jgi:hypothetical protein
MQPDKQFPHSKQIDTKAQRQRKLAIMLKHWYRTLPCVCESMKILTNNICTASRLTQKFKGKGSLPLCSSIGQQNPCHAFVKALTASRLTQKFKGKGSLPLCSSIGQQ